MAAPQVPIDNLTLPAGATWEVSWTFDDEVTGGPANFSGWQARMEIRDHTGALLTSAKSTAGWDGTITLDTTGTTGNVTVTIGQAITYALTPGLYLYDLELISPDAFVTRAVEGKVRVSPEQTTNA